MPQAALQSAQLSASAAVYVAVDKLLGFILLAIGAVLLYLGWEWHAAVPPDIAETARDPRTGRSIWMLGLGAVSAVWGLFALLRRRAF